MLPGNGNHGDGAGEWRRILQDAATGKRNTPGADNNDVTWYQQHLADGYVEGYSWGDWGTKKQAIKRAQDKSLKFNKGEISEVKVATFDPNVAIAHYKFTYDGTIDGTHRARTVICSDTWISQSGDWKVASNHCSHVEGK